MKRFLVWFYRTHRLNPMRILWISLGLNLGLNLIFVLLTISLTPMGFEPVHQEFKQLLVSSSGWRFFLLILYLSTIFAMIAGLVFGLVSEVKRRVKLENSLQQAELTALKAQIQPHFLFNTLNTIKVLLREDAEKADQVLQQLSELYHYVLMASSKEMTTLEEELDYIDMYLAIEKVRFGDHLTYQIDVDSHFRRFPIPSLLLQPLVENCIKHGISQKLEPGTISITVQPRANSVYLVISDNGPGFPVPPDKISQMTSGHGLKNVNERWKLYSGKSIEITSKSGNGTHFYLELK